MLIRRAIKACSDGALEDALVRRRNIARQRGAPMNHGTKQAKRPRYDDACYKPLPLPLPRPLPPGRHCRCNCRFHRCGHPNCRFRGATAASAPDAVAAAAVAAATAAEVAAATAAASPATPVSTATNENLSEVQLLRRQRAYESSLPMLNGNA